MVALVVTQSLITFSQAELVAPEFGFVVFFHKLACENESNGEFRKRKGFRMPLDHLLLFFLVVTLQVIIYPMAFCSPASSFVLTASMPCCRVTRVKSFILHITPVLNRGEGKIKCLVCFFT